MFKLRLQCGSSVYILAVLLAGLPMLYAEKACGEYTAYRIRKIKFQGIDKVRAGTIKRSMSTQFPSRFAWLPWVGLPEYDEGTLERDIRNIEELYKSLGYYNAKINHEVDINDEKRLVSIRIKVNEGRLVIIKSVTVTDKQGSFSGGEFMASMNELVQIKEGEPFLIEPYKNSKNAMQRYLSNHGYPKGRIEGQVVVDKRSYKAEVAFHVYKGTCTYFGDIAVKGLNRVDEKFVLRELTFQEGSVYSAEEIYQSQQNLVRLGLFDSVIINAPYNRPGVTNTVPVDITVSESPRNMLRLGGGYGNEEGLRITGHVLRRYFIDRPGTLNLFARNSYIMSSVSTEYYQPYFLNRKTNLDLRFGYDRENLETYANERISGQAKLGRQAGTRYSAFTAYSLELNRPRSANEALIAELLAENPEEYYLISAILFGVEYNEVDDILYPLNGFSASVYAEPASYLLGASIDYLKGILTLRTYQTLFSDVVIAVRGEAGFIKPYRFTGNIPVFKRFFLGGSNDVRGYPFQSISPVGSTNQAVGGNAMAMGNIELRYPFYKKLRGTLFIDGGDVFRTNFEFGISTFKYGVGTGVQYVTPIGPVSLDLAFPLNRLVYKDISPYQVYLRLGNAY